MNICVFCASSENIAKSYITAGENLGKTMADRAHTLVFGAGKYGIMGAVARGVRTKDGNIIGVVPEFFNELDVIYDECTELIYTETMRQRKQIMEDRSEGFIIMPGGMGTFEEFYEILTLKQLRRHKKPIAVYNVNNYYGDMIKMFDTAIDQGFMSEECKKLFLVSDDPEEILGYFESYTPFEYDKYDYLNKNRENRDG